MALRRHLLENAARWHTSPNQSAGHPERIYLSGQRHPDIEHQKNGVRDATLNHEAVPGPFCPVKTLARRYVASRQTQPDNEYALLCSYAPQKVLTAKHIDQILQRAAFRTTIWMEGFALDWIGTHSIRASGAMQLYLNGVSEAKIMKIGR